MKNDYNAAISFYEKGIEVDPGYPSNYYRAAKIFCHTDEQVWGMIYGEIFMNLERNSQRTAEISKLLFDTYKSHIKFTSDTSLTVDFGGATIIIDDKTIKDPKNFKLPFGAGAYGLTLTLAVTGEKTIDINSLDRIRTRFVQEYFNKDNATKYPNVLFDYQQKINVAGYLEAYNHWILMKGDETGFNRWLAENKTKWDAFRNWFSENKIVLDQSHKFYRAQY
jgi:hypothetical protein